MPDLDGCDETVAPAADGLNESWRRRGVAERGAEPADGVVQTVVEVHERLGPESLTQLLSRDDCPGPRDQHFEEDERLILNQDTVAEPPEIATATIELELPKSHDCLTCLSVHDRSTRCPLRG
jgi:hypothetical protein